MQLFMSLCDTPKYEKKRTQVAAATEGGDPSADGEPGEGSRRDCSGQRFFRVLPALAIIIIISSALSAQTTQHPYAPTPLDLTAAIASPKLESQLHQPLPEQYIWAQRPRSAGMGFSFPARGYTPRWVYFRRSFELSTVPTAATLYVAGPARMRVYLNGQLLANAEQDPGSKIYPNVLVLDVSRSLHLGPNVLALAAANGRSLAAKIVPLTRGVNAPSIVMS
ncbi:MAG: hypothetical protein ACRD3O_24225, partial [Terriglobia bacterium]